MKNWFLLLALIYAVEGSNSPPCKVTTAPNNGGNQSTLVLLHILYRHGNRYPAPEEIYPKDPHRYNTYPPFGLGELTNQGRLREYRLGQEFRTLYNKFLGIYTPDGVYGRSTDLNRTKESLLLRLAGLYPPDPVQVWLPGFKWQPIPTRYKPQNIDFLLADPLVNCPAYVKQLLAYESSEQFAAINDKNIPLYEYLTENTGWSVTTPLQVYELFFDLFAEQDLGLGLPQWTRTVWPEQISSVAIEWYLAQTATPALKRRAGGPLLQRIVNNTLAKIQGNLVPDRKIFLYSAHENNVAFQLILLGIFCPARVPSYGSYISYEVHSIKRKYYIRIVIEDFAVTHGSTVVTIPNCSEYCPVEKFVQLMESNFPTAEDVC